MQVEFCKDKIDAGKTLRSVSLRSLSVSLRGVCLLACAESLSVRLRGVPVC